MNSIRDATPITRLATPADAPTVHALTQAAFTTLHGKIDPPSSADLESVDAVAESLTAGGGGLAEINGTPVGAVRFSARDDHLYVGRVAVVPDFRGRGVARALMALAERHAAALGLPETRIEVRKTLIGNVARFERLGYTVISEYPHPKRPESTVLTLSKPIASESPDRNLDG